MTTLPDETDAAFLALTTKISRDRGFACGSYKERCLRRRIAVRMRARGVHTFEDYANLLDRDAHEYDRLLDALTINVTKFFRNWEAWDAMSQTLVPELWQSALPTIRVWSAGCASGEEPYSLAALFLAHADARGEGDRARRVSVLGTDIDDGCLARAARATYEEGAFADTPDALRAKYFEPAPSFSPVAAVRRLVRFEKRDLLAEAAPPGEFDLVVCRNVLIYFDRDTQERLFDVFHAALRSGGFLVLGKVETLLGAARSRFAPIDSRERIFRKP